jgi:predicted homoserine dehydrogenase-like protein
MNEIFEQEYLMLIRKRLEELEEQGKPVKVGIVGLGAMGTGTLHMMNSMTGIRCLAAADLEVENAIKAYQGNGINRDDILVSDNTAKSRNAIAKGKCVATDNALMLPELDLDVILEATGSTSFGARVAYESILGGKHTVMLTVEADVIVGPVLARMADSAGVVYTLASGDQPGAILELYHWANTLGFEIVAAGRGEVCFEENRFEGPHEERKGRSWISNSPKMANSFRDGTKAQIEMAAVSNATGLVPDVKGMHEPHVSVNDLPRVFALKEDGGVLSRKGVIEIANSVTDDQVWVKDGQVGSGVFVVIDSDHPGVEKFIKQFFGYQGGKGGALYRPYHMTCLEVPISIARAAVLKTETAKPKRLFTEVTTAAKKDLTVGETLDGGGGFTVYAQVEKAEVARNENALPFGFAEKIKTTRPVKKNQILSYEDVELERDDFLYKLRQIQDSTIG